MNKNENKVLTKLQIEVAKIAIILERFEKAYNEDMGEMKESLKTINEEMGSLDKRIGELESGKKVAGAFWTVLKIVSIPAISTIVTVLVTYLLTVL